MEVISYHLFGNGWDEWFDTGAEANKAYEECDDAELRLYKEIHWNDYEVEEEYIKGRGYFPW